MDIVLWPLYDNIYTKTYKHFSEGGPKCYKDMTNTFLYFNLSCFCDNMLSQKCWIKIKVSNELTRALVKKPKIFEFLIGLACWGTFVVQTGNKLYTGRIVIMNNPCLIVLLTKGYVLLAKKSINLVLSYIFDNQDGYMEYLQYLIININIKTLKFLVVTGLELPLDRTSSWSFCRSFVINFKWKIFLFLNGRHSLMGFSCSLLKDYFYMLTISLMTWANLNFILCRQDHDPFVPFIGIGIMCVLEIYLKLVSIITITILFQLWFLEKSQDIKKQD